nr:DUF4474 domain-containing protein [Lachnospiraceae bacterium]
MILVILSFIIAVFRTKWAVKKVKQETEEEKIQKLDEVLRPFGFLYDPGQDIMYSRLHPWQRNLGYEKAFDEGAVLLSMVIDCEPIYFEYEGRRWLIELWKGQYGMTTGAELGVYRAEKPEDFKPGDERNLHYDAVENEDLLQMQYVLYRDGEEIIRRRARHWWLTAFEPGLYSRPENLTMCVKIVFPTERMCYAFFRGLLDAGYRSREAYFGGNYVTLYYSLPKLKQPGRKYGILRWLAQKNNKRNCRLYQKRTRVFVSDLDKITFLRYRYPLLYRALFGFTRWRRLRGRKRHIPEV